MRYLLLSLLLLTCCLAADTQTLRGTSPPSGNSDAIEATFIVGVISAVMVFGGFALICGSGCFIGELLGTIMLIVGIVGCLICWPLYVGYSNCWKGLC